MSRRRVIPKECKKHPTLPEPVTVLAMLKAEGWARSSSLEPHFRPKGKAERHHNARIARLEAIRLTGYTVPRTTGRAPSPFLYLTTTRGEHYQIGPRGDARRWLYRTGSIASPGNGWGWYTALRPLWVWTLASEMWVVFLRLGIDTAPIALVAPGEGVAA